MTNTAHWAHLHLETVIMSHIQSERNSREPAICQPACMTPGCSTNCSFGYSCHNQRLGRGPVIAWPMVALAGLLIAMLLI